MIQIPEALWGKAPVTDDNKRPKWEFVDELTEEDREDNFTLEDLQRDHEESHEGYEYEHRKGFEVITLDPPWLERGGGKIKRGADRHYPLVHTRELPSVILGSGVFVPSKSCHMYMWATNNFLPDALWLMGALGFTYVTNVTWVKMVGSKTAMTKLSAVISAGGSPADIAAAMVSYGIGQYFRGAHEMLLVGEHDPTDIILFGRRGSGTETRTTAKNLPGVIFAPKSEHSVKPEIAYELFEKRSKGPKLEMFARRKRDGWTCWGDQAPE